jgi:DNA-directed RNA polymerase specialized sigma subunit
MRTTYLVWKTPPQNGEAPDWQQIKGKDFLALVRSPESEGRYFIKLPSTNGDFSDTAIVMETTEAEYLKWKREKNHADYLKNCGKHITVISYHIFESDEEQLPNPANDFEPQFLNAMALDAALASLTDEEYRLVEFLYLSDKPGTVREYEQLTGMPKSTVSRRHKAVIEKIKVFFED